jgi:O-antigen ligase
MKGLIFTFALTYGGVLVALFRPYYGFLIYVCFGILKPESLWHWSVPQGTYSRIIAIGLLTGWILNGMGKWRFGRGTPIIVSMIGYFLVIVFGAVTAPQPNLAWPAVEAMGKVFLPILVGATLIDSVAKVRQLAWVIVLSQGYLAYEFNLTYLAGLLNPADWQHAGLDSNGIAITMVTSAGLAFYLGLHAERWWRMVIAFFAAALMAHVVLFSKSRGGMVALLITMATCFFLTPKRPRDFLYLALAVALLLRMAGDSVQERFLTIFEGQKANNGAYTGFERVDQWKACWDSMLRHPLGIGPRHWRTTAAQLGLPNQEAHSTWFQMGAELGWPGAICIMGFYGTCLSRLWPLTRERTPVPDPWLRYLARMVIAALIGFLISASFVTTDGVELPYYITLVGMGTLRMASQIPPRRRNAAIARPVATTMRPLSSRFPPSVARRIL